MSTELTGCFGCRGYRRHLLLQRSKAYYQLGTLKITDCHLNYEKHHCDISVPTGIVEVMFLDLLRVKTSLKSVSGSKCFLWMYIV